MNQYLLFYNTDTELKGWGWVLVSYIVVYYIKALSQDFVGRTSFITNCCNIWQFTALTIKSKIPEKCVITSYGSYKS